MDKPTPFEASGRRPMTPEEAMRNKLAGIWVMDHWNEIEDAALEEGKALRKRKEDWIESEMAKLRSKA